MRGGAHRVGAFFDIDGTLVPGPSLEQRMFRALRRKGEISWTNYARWGAEALRLLPRGLFAIFGGNKKYLYRLRAEQLLDAMEPIAFFEEAVARAEWHARQGHAIVLVSGTVKPIARMTAMALECELEARGIAQEVAVSATRLEEHDGVYTGRVIGEANYGEAKRKAIVNVARALEIELRESHAYGNTVRDLPMLEAVGRAHAVNPGKELARWANQLDWMIWHWHQEKNPSLGEKFRQKVKFQMIGTRTLNGMKKDGAAERPNSRAMAATAAYPCDTAVWNAKTEMRASAWTTFRQEAAAAWAACGAFEWWAFGYFAVSGALIVLFAEHLEHPVRLLAVRSAVVCAILCLCRTQAIYAQRNVGGDASFSALWWHFWRYWYPHLFFLFCFEELAQLMTLIEPRWQDAKLIAFDHWLTGVHPSVWLEPFATPGRNEFMQLAYLSYFAYLVVLGGILYYRREWHAYWSVMVFSMVGYSIGYLIAMSFPIESPWFAMAGWWKGPLNGGPITATINFIEHYGKVRGAAFPSEHIAGSAAVLWGAWRFRRWLFWMMLPVALLMFVSTIWGRYHYIADIIGGIITGTCGYLIGSWVMKKKGAVKTAGPGVLQPNSAG